MIVVDDGSDDGSLFEAESDAARGRPVRSVRQDGLGAVAARTAGVAMSRAPVIAFTDSDCVPSPQWLEAGVAAVEAGADVVQGVTKPRRHRRPLERTVFVDREDGLYATCNVFYRRDAFVAAGGFDQAAGRRLRFRPGRRSRGLGFGEDTLLGWRVRRAGRAMFVPDAVVEHEVFPPDLTETFARAVMAGAFPALVREVPELRDTLLWGRYLLGPSRLPLYASVVTALTGRRRLAVALALVWASQYWKRADGPLGPRRAAVAGVLATLDLATGCALVSGSMRARCLVL